MTRESRLLLSLDEISGLRRASTATSGSDRDVIVEPQPLEESAAGFDSP